MKSLEKHCRPNVGIASWLTFYVDAQLHRGLGGWLPNAPPLLGGTDKTESKVSRIGTSPCWLGTRSREYTLLASEVARKWSNNACVIKLSSETY